MRITNQSMRKSKTALPILLQFGSYRRGEKYRTGSGSDRVTPSISLVEMTRSLPLPVLYHSSNLAVSRAL